MNSSSKKPKPAPASPLLAGKARSRYPLITAGLFAGVLLLAASRFVWDLHAKQPIAANAPSDYVDPSICAECHEDIAATYRKTGMGRSFYRPTAKNITEDYARNNTLEHKLSGYTYTMEEHDGKFFQRRHTIGFDGKEANVVEEPVDYVIGSGNHARTYLHRTKQGQLAELPVSWYSENGGSWAMSPGYDRKDQEDIRRLITPECLFCHNGYPEVGANAMLTEIESGSFPADLPQGIDCQRCHGPGAAHVKAAQSSSVSLPQIRALILNPAILGKERQMEVCEQCHLETTSSHTSNEIRPYDRGIFSYRPGEPLGDYKIYFEREKDKSDDRFEVDHAAYRLRQSACFRKSGMTCTTCHDPHDISRGEEAVQGYTAVCLNCHKGVAHRSTLPVGSNCVSCHMPKRRTDDVVHVVMTDHFIRSYEPSRDLRAAKRETIQQETASDLVPYYPTNFAKRVDADLYTAVAKVNAGSDTQSLSSLENALVRAAPAAPEPYFALGRAYSRRRDNAKAIEWFEAALKHKQNYRPAYEELSSPLITAGQEAQARKILEQGVTLFPDDARLLTNLGNVYLRMNMATEARDSLTRAVAVNPEGADAHNLLGLVALRVGDKVSAERSFREAIRWQPDLAEAHNNLANLLTGGHELKEAEFHFREALRINPEYAEAHHGLALLLILKGATPEATRELLEAIRLKPASAQTHDDLADAFAAQGMIAQAAEEYRQVLRLDPQKADAHLGLGLALLRQNKAQEARLQLEAAATSGDSDVSQAANESLSHIRH